MTQKRDPAYLGRAKTERWNNFSVARHGRMDGFLVTSKNSGTHWLKYMFAVAIADTFGVPRPRYFSQAATEPYIGGPKSRPVYHSLPRLAFSHSIPHALMNETWFRRALDLPPYVLLVRHPMAILASHHAKWEYDIEVDWLTYLKGDPSGKQFRCDLYWIARFWNRWSEIEKHAHGLVLRLHYEDVQRDPRAALQSMADHWRIALAPNAIEAALEAGTKDAMALKIDPEAEPNVLQKRSASLTEQFSGEAFEIYREQVETYFDGDLGYDLLTVPTGH